MTRITGGAGPEEVAAILAVVAQVTAEEQAASAAPPVRFTPGPWELSARPRPVVGPGRTLAPVPREWLAERQETEGEGT
ncbi:MAG: acyl-CoA carboxylase epsilon subunit [Acidimicrobiia bacterium]